MTDEGDVETKEGMSELMASSQFDFDFSYGGKTISAEEMLVRLFDLLFCLHVCCRLHEGRSIKSASWIL